MKRYFRALLEIRFFSRVLDALLSKKRRLASLNEHFLKEAQQRNRKKKQFLEVPVRYLLMMVLLYAECVAATSTAMYPFTSQAHEIRFNELTQAIRCVVCQNQNIADSNAPLANDLRNKIYAMIQDNKNDQEIKQFMFDRYGDYIFLRPPFRGATLLLWLFPLLCLTVVGFIFFLRII